ncbi:ATP-binding protein [Cohnella suwonensis]|uniref:histidine kinase n=1 Tax=Cohnella suwonensis TaxID=696072 RepID=A0ABW0LQD0_9BACL
MRRQGDDGRDPGERPHRHLAGGRRGREGRGGRGGERRRLRDLRLFAGDDWQTPEERERIRELGKQMRPPAKYIWLSIIGMHLVIAGTWGLSYLIMHAVFQSAYPELEWPIWRQFLTIELAFFLLLGFIHLVRLFYRPLRRQMEWFFNLIIAMKELSKGNFDVTFKSNPKYMGQFGPLVSTFNEMASELHQMERMRQEFISNVSHEFQSPLTSIAGFARALRTDELPAETTSHYLDIIETESKRLSRLSDNLLKLTSLESKHHPFEPKPYRLDRQLRHIILSCEPLWQRKNIEMDVDLPEATIVADEDLMSQVWINLLHNSIKFTPEGGTVGVRLTTSDDRIHAVVYNSGPDISPQALPHLFERFFKEDKARERAGGGSGLGLSIVKKIVDMHDGDIAASNRPKGGAQFAVSLPSGS